MYILLVWWEETVEAKPPPYDEFPRFEVRLLVLVIVRVHPHDRRGAMGEEDVICQPEKVRLSADPRRRMAYQDMDSTLDLCILAVLKSGLSSRVICSLVAGRMAQILTHRSSWNEKDEQHSPSTRMACSLHMLR